MEMIQKNLEMVKQDLIEVKKARKKRVLSTELFTLAIMALCSGGGKLIKNSLEYQYPKEAIITQNNQTTKKEIELVSLNENVDLKLYYQSAWLTNSKSKEAYRFRVNANSVEDIKAYLNTLENDVKSDAINSKVNLEIETKPKDQVDFTEKSFCYQEYINKEKKIYVPLDEETEKILNRVFLVTILALGTFVNVELLLPSLKSQNSQIKNYKKRIRSFEELLEIDTDK